MAYAASTILLETLEQFSTPNKHLILAKNIPLQSFTENLKFFQEFLQGISSKRDNDRLINRIEARIRDVVYKAQDLIDEFVSDNAGQSPEVIDIFDQKYIIHHTLNQISEEIDSIRAEAMKMYEKISADDSILKDLSRNNQTKFDTPKEVDDNEGSKIIVNFPVCSATKLDDCGEDGRKFDASKKGVDTVVKMDAGCMMIVDRLLSSSARLEIISILGGKQMGKSALARSAYNYPMLEKIFDFRVYLRESRRLQQRDILRYILSSVEGKQFDEKYEENEESIGECLYLRLRNRRFPIIIDDIWSSQVFDNISRCFPRDQTGSRIILTSRFMDVATCPYIFSGTPIPVKHFPSIIEDWEYIREKVFAQTSCPPELNSIGLEIAEKCQGLQELLNKAAGFLLRASNTPQDWQNFSRSLGGTLKIFFHDTSFYICGDFPELSEELDSTGINQETDQEEVVIGVEDKQENVVVGLENDLIKMKDQLMGNSRRLEIVTVVGMGGIGKTTLAKAVFDDPLVKYRFYIHAWIKISQVYQLRDLLLGLLQTVVDLDDEIHRMNNDQLRAKLYRCLKGQRFLIVMDDMWSTRAWDEMRRCFPDDRNGSRILLTSRLKNLAEHVSPNPPHQMSFLNKHQSWKLLQQRIFLKQNCPPELVKLGKKIAEKCQGLPLAILVVAGLLSNMSKTCDIWENIAESMPRLLTDDLNQFQEILAMSYNYLPHQLKACFLYFCAFPEDCEIQYWRLIRLLVAEGFVKPECFSLEEVAEEYVEDLIGRNLVLVGKRSYSGNIKTCYIHDLLRDLSLREARKENFMHVITGPVQIPLEENSIVRRLSLHSGSFGNFYSELPLRLARSLLCFDIGFGTVGDIHTFLSNFSFKLLRVLDIDFMRFDYFPRVILNLINLRFIAITAACDIPSSISKLLNLQTLIVHGPWLTRKFGKSPNSPTEVWKLSWLRHLNLSAACFLPDPLRVEEDQNNSLVLANLQTLSTIRPTSCTEEVLKNLPNLKKLQICEIKEDFDSDKGLSCFPCNLFYLHHLETLKCSFYDQNQKIMRLPDWNAFPPKLKRLTLRTSHLSWDDMDTLGMLPNLEILKLKSYAFQGEVWEPNEGGFNSLKLLLIEKTNLVRWKANIYSFPCLEYLILRSCQSLEEIPYDIADNLQLIELQNCSSSAESSALKIQEEQRKRDNDDLVVRILSEW